ncbi:hypothetical protein DMN91_000581 [Ooceraea biroi]|uniref:Protein bric-a-brac n=1 Tax=Ooceraea biroi TaxID=2015173 RepID=A0A026WDU3_OOCBI|nr:protein tramtrack, beta isoform [Ooceraea biroi]EZA54232.1 Protein bric-a-brac [Ooceraea biroi]RLU26784.1 hypothetical protein DMN91_000581 [Ooceraea biroi]
METTSSQQYRLRWNNHRTNLLNVFEELLQNEEFTDVTLAVENNLIIRCHKIVLAACSSYFQRLFLELPCKHPVVVLKDVKYSEIKAILEYMYRGEVNVAQEQLTGMLKVAEALKVKGLIDENGGEGSVHDDSRREDRHVETSMSPPPAISTSTGTSTTVAHSSAHDASPPHSTDGAYGSYAKSAIDHGHNRLALSMWGLPMHHAAHQSSPHSSSVAAVLGTSSYDNGFENVPFKRRKLLHSNLLMNRDTPILRTVLGQGHADSSQSISTLPPPDGHEAVNFRTSSNGSANDNDNRRSSSDLAHGEVAHSPYTDVSFMDEDEKQPSPQSYPGDSKSGIANYVPQKPEWKRYKQYTRDDIMSAIEAVKGGMSAVQAARKHGVPSRTLYDKVKKLGITTSRPFKRSASNGSSGACFPYGIGGNVNGGIYSGALSENESSNVNIAESTASRGSAALETTYAKAKDVPPDRDSVSDSMAPCSPSPVMRCAKQKQQQESMDDQVEDLSVSRKSDVPVIVPPSTAPDAIKVEAQDVGPDNSDCCDYN